jgi:hypothetical protein
MPPDPFSAPQGDWAPMAAGLSGFYASLVAHGMPAGNALTLTDSLMKMMLANALVQQQKPAGGV